MLRNTFQMLRSTSMLHSQRAIISRGGGHGWARPDVPLIIPYEHKRIISIFDVNLWFYCGVSPEYCINTNEAYLGNALGGIKQAVLDFKVIAGVLILVFFMNDYLQFSKPYGIIPDATDMYAYKLHVQTYNERPMLKNKHFLGFSIKIKNKIFKELTPENGNLHFEPYIKSHQLIKYEQWIAETRQNINQSLEAKNYIQRVEKEATSAVLKAKAQ